MQKKPKLKLTAKTRSLPAAAPRNGTFDRRLGMVSITNSGKGRKTCAESSTSKLYSGFLYGLHNLTHNAYVARNGCNKSWNCYCFFAEL